MSLELPFSEAFEYASSVTSEKFTNPFWRVSDIMRGAKFGKCIKEVKAFGAGLVSTARSRRSKYAKKNEGRASMQKNLIDSLLDHISSDQVVADAAMNFLSAGRDTTAQSLAWTVYSLLRNPLSMKKLLATLDTGAPNDERGPQMKLSYEICSAPNAFPFVQACFAESLRLNPAVPLEIKESTAVCVLPDGTELPKGSAVVWLPYTWARSPDIWGLDASVFRPDRWLEESANGDLRVVTRSAYENPVFNGGPRMCVGKRMAEVLALRILPDILRHWQFEEAHRVGQRVLGEGLTAPMRDGLPVRVSRQILSRPKR